MKYNLKGSLNLKIEGVKKDIEFNITDLDYTVAVEGAEIVGIVNGIVKSILEVDQNDRHSKIDDKFCLLDKKISEIKDLLRDLQ